MRQFTYALLLFIFASGAAPLNGWTHLELGAGNYGSDGHTKTSQSMTVLKKLDHVSPEKNYIDELEETGRGDYKPEEQYGVLFWTLDELVNRNGAVGVFYVNDLYEEYALFAKQKLTEYARSKGYDSIIIEALSGDYESIDLQQPLSRYGKTKYSSMHLKNPEISLYYDRMEGDYLFSSEKSRNHTRLILKNLSNLSEEGLYLFILNHVDYIPLEEKIEFMDKGIFYHPTTTWDSVPYIFPEGHVIDKTAGTVFYIQPNGT